MQRPWDEHQAVQESFSGNKRVFMFIYYERQQKNK